MANVTTWSELVYRLSESHPDDVDTTINLMNDIDMNDVSPLGVSTTQIKCFGRSMVLNGNGHCIKNLRTSISNPQPIFSMADYHYLSTKALNIRNLDFVNLICAGSDFLYDSSDYRQVNFTNCRFVGCRTGNAYLINQSTKISCTSCYFDMPWYGSGSSVYDYTSLVKRSDATTNIPVANYCWFHETYGGWTITNSESADVVRPPQEYPVTQCSMFAMNGCYIDGTMKSGMYHWNAARNGLFYAAVYRKEIGNYYTAATPNVIDMHWSTTMSSVQYTTVKVFNMSAVFKESYNSGTFPAYEYQRVSIGSQPNIILATPEQMQNPIWLQSQGFPIIIPTT